MDFYILCAVSLYWGKKKPKPFRIQIKVRLFDLVHKPIHRFAVFDS